MRICSIVLALVMAAATSAIAQDQPAAVGVKGGVNFADLQFDTDAGDGNFDRRAGFVGGLFVIWPANRRVALQTEALFSQKGAKVDQDGIDGKIKLDYLDVPVLLRVSSNPLVQTSFHAFAGPSFGIRVRARAKGDFEGETSDEDISDDIERLDMGLVVGAGIDIGHLTIDGRYSWGLSDVFKDDEVKVKNRVLSIMAGFRF